MPPIPSCILLSLSLGHYAERSQSLLGESGEGESPGNQKDIFLLSFLKPFPQRKEVLGESVGDPDFFMSGS